MGKSECMREGGHQKDQVQGNEQGCDKGRTWTRKQARKRKCGKGWPQERKAKRWDKAHGVWEHGCRRNCQHVPACAKRVLERGKAHEKRGHKKGGAIWKGNAQEIERGKAQGEGQRNGVRKQASRCEKD